ncbi:MAG TPA: FabA/FabZ family ACP-dehydratase [Chitinophagaceae bacterium]|jgi:3-hydroxyacyl-[acyl-carrier-protein] dehydratase
MDDQYKYILDYLPFKSSFRFVDSISFIDENRVSGRYTLRKDAFFYEDHFKDRPVTPGVILIEIMAQIGMVTLGIYNLLFVSSEDPVKGKFFPIFTSTEVEFFKMVLPGETVEVRAEKKYYRLNKLKCHVEMYDLKNELIARGNFAGIIKSAQ